MMRRSIILTLLITGLLLPNVAAAAGLELILTLKSANKIGQVKAKYNLQVLEQVGQEPIFLVQADGTDADLISRMTNDRSVTDVEPNGLVALESKPQPIAGGVIDLDQSTMSLFQRVMSLFGEGSPTHFFGTEVPEHYADQIALDVVHASDTRHITTGAGTRIAFIDTGVDPDHPAIRPWLEPGVNLLGGGSASEFGGIDQSTMSLFEDLVRNLKNSSIDMSTMSLFWEQLLALGLDQSTMSLFWEQLRAGTLDQSTMSLFWAQLFAGTLDQSTMSLFWEVLQKLDVDQSTMSLFWEQLLAGTLDQSTMSLFWEEMQRFTLDQSTMSLFWEQLQFLYVNQSTMSLFGNGMFDRLGHGTLVAGLLHAVAPEAQLVPIRAFDSQGRSTLFFAVAAVYAAAAQDVDVINMSFSIGAQSKSMTRALNFAWSRGIAMVASIGNDSRLLRNDVYPAEHNNVIAVASTDFEDRLASFSNYGFVDVTAPGVGVATTFPGGLYARASGTSFSAPIVSAGVALLISVGNTNRSATQAIIHTSDDIEPVNLDSLWNELGWGRVNLHNALGGPTTSTTNTTSTSTTNTVNGKGKAKGKKRN